MIVSIVLLTSLVATVTAFAKSEASTVNSANAAAYVRLTLLQLQHDIQSANPLDALGSVSAYSDELQVTIQPSGSVITWQYTPSTEKLTRQVGNATPVVELTGVNNGAGLPVFHYFDHCAVDLVSEAESTVSSIASSTTVVQVVLSVADLDSAPYGTTTSVNIMNKPPGETRCGS